MTPRGALPPQCLAAPAADVVQQRLVRDSVRAVLERLERPPPAALRDDDSFASLGLDSMGHVDLAAELGARLGLELDPALAFNYPTVGSLAQWLAEWLAESRRGA